jgi:hypothetical protein
VPSVAPFIHVSAARPSRRRLRVRVDPSPIPFDIPVSLTVYAHDAELPNNTVQGTVWIDGQQVGTTGRAFTYTFRMRRERVFDPDTRTWGLEEYPPTGTIKAPGYMEAAIDFFWQEAPPSPPPSPGELHARIAKLAYELYVQRGRRHGYDLADWLAAERQLVSH